jgi:CheY-like chemotaxis protein
MTSKTDKKDKPQVRLLVVDDNPDVHYILKHAFPVMIF